MTAAPVLARTIKYTVSVAKGVHSGQSFVFEKPVVTLGRGPENDIVLAEDPKVSRTHAEIRLQRGQLIVRNISQKNFILVNGERYEEKTLSEGVSTIHLGDTVLEIKIEQTEDSSVEDAGKTVKYNSPVLRPLPPQAQSPLKPQVQVQQHQMHTQTQAPPPRQTFPRSQSQGGSRLRFYAIVAVVLGLGYWLISDQGAGKKPEVQLRTEGDVVRAIEESAQAVQELRKQQVTVGKDTLQYKAAQEHYIKGFRDYRQGQYARAMQSFQAALSFYPAHELARKYLLQSQRKFEAQIDFNMSQGRKYYQKQNYKMCQSSFASVMMMVKDSTRPKYKEAKQFYDECSFRQEGRF